MTYKTDQDHHKTLVEVFTAQGGELNQDAFDREFLQRTPPMCGWDRDDTIYTGGRNGYIWLEILLHAVSAGHFKVKGKHPNKTYTLV